MKEIWATYHFGIIFPRYSFFKPIFDDIIFRLLENGIITKWDKQFYSHENNNYVEVVMEKLKMDNLRVTFVCLLILHGVAVGIFLLELIWYHAKVICQR